MQVWNEVAMFCPHFRAQVRDTRREKKEGGRGREKGTCWLPANIARATNGGLGGSSPRATAPERLRAALSFPNVSHRSFL